MAASKANKDKRGGKADKDSGEQLIVKNRRATFDYAIDDKYEGGLVLVGSEVKAMRNGTVDIVDAYASVDKNECWLRQLYIAPFAGARSFPHEPRAPRKVLLHKKEIAALDEQISRGGYTVIPLRLYFKDGRVKVELGVAKGKKVHDKRQTIAKETADREARAAIGRGRKGE